MLASDPSVCPIQLAMVSIAGTNRFRLTVTNVGAVPVGWDSQFVAFLKWRFSDDAGEPLPTTEPDDQLEPRQNQRERFVTLLPDASLSKEFDLAKPWAVFVSGHGSFDVGDIPAGYETLIRFILPNHPKRVKVEVAYAPQGDDWGGFHVWFGFDVRDVRLWFGECENSSATITVVVEDPSAMSDEMSEEQAKEMILHFLAADRTAKGSAWIEASKRFITHGDAALLELGGETHFIWGPWDVNATSRRVRLTSNGASLNADAEWHGRRYVLRNVQITRVRRRPLGAGTSARARSRS